MTWPCGKLEMLKAGNISANEGTGPRDPAWFTFWMLLAPQHRAAPPGIMSAKSHENLKAIRFAGELLPNWAQLLDLAARLCPVSEDVRRWFSRLTKASGVDDARTVIAQCRILQASIQEHRESLATELKRSREDVQPSQVLGAWMYALDTMIQAAQTGETCSWIVEGTEEKGGDDSGGGEITLRRV